MMRHITQPRLAATAAALALLAAGCAAPPVAPGTPMPERFAFTLWTRSADLRVTWFVLEADGRLSFAGGQDAVVRSARPIGRLTDAQRRELWEIAATTGLMEAADQPFAEAKRVQYRFDFKAGPWSRQFRTVDSAAPGAEAFHDAVFRMQSELRRRELPGF